MKLHEEFKLFETMWEETDKVMTKSITEGWYGADSEVEFETSVYNDIAEYFGLNKTDKVYYAYYFLDEVIVNYTDVSGHDHEIERHVPIDQVEEWFKAGYTILEERHVKGKNLKKSCGVAEIKAEMKESAPKVTKSDSLTEALTEKEYSIVYRLKDWPAAWSDDEAFFDAETATDAIKFFIEYMLNPDNLDDDSDMINIITEDDIIIISVAPTGA